MSLHVPILQIMSSFWNLSSFLYRVLPCLPIIHICILLLYWTLYWLSAGPVFCCGCQSPYCLLSFLTSTQWKVKVKVTQSCLTLCNPMYYTVHGILQARILEWVAVPFSRGSSQPRSPPLQANSLLLIHQGGPFYPVSTNNALQSFWQSKKKKYH